MGKDVRFWEEGKTTISTIAIHTKSGTTAIHIA